MLKANKTLNCLIQKVISSIMLFPARPDGLLNIFDFLAEMDDFIVNTIDSITEVCATNITPCFVLDFRRKHNITG